MPSFFSPKSRLSVSRPLAVTMNTLNVLAPTLLVLALILSITARLGNHPFEVHQLLVQAAAMLVVGSIVVRIAWGICIHMIKKQKKKTPAPTQSA